MCHVDMTVAETGISVRCDFSGWTFDHQCSENYDFYGLAAVLPRFSRLLTNKMFTKPVTDFLEIVRNFRFRITCRLGPVTSFNADGKQTRNWLDTHIKQLG